MPGGDSVAHRQGMVLDARQQHVDIAATTFEAMRTTAQPAKAQDVTQRVDDVNVSTVAQSSL